MLAAAPPNAALTVSAAAARVTVRANEDGKERNRRFIYRIPLETVPAISSAAWITFEFIS